VNHSTIFHCHSRSEPATCASIQSNNNNNNNIIMPEGSIKKRKISTPPDGYVCKLCNESGHWIQQCSLKMKKKKKKTHIPVPGVDPSAQDIDKARELQKIPPPNCFCGQKSRLKKVKRSHIGGESSKAIGKYFFFCPKQRGNDPCRFARPVEEEIKDKKERVCAFFVRTGTCKKGDKCKFLHDASQVQVPHWKQRQQKKDGKRNDIEESTETMENKVDSSDSSQSSDSSDSSDTSSSSTE